MRALRPVLPPFRHSPASWAAVSLFGGLSLLSGCQKSGAPTADASTSKTPVKTTPVARPVNLDTDKPNELGRVPILEYHQIEPKEARWARTPAHFRADLERLYKLGYYPVSLMDYVHGTLNPPPGRSPVVITFDDSDPGQFRYLGSGASAKLDPNCAVAMMLDMARRHPDFPAKATFYVLPSLFGQPAFEAQKMKELKEWGFEIGNHTYTHPSLRLVSRQVGLTELAKGVGVTQKSLPGYNVASIALPNGSVPKDDSILRGGTASGVTYRHEAALLVGAEPAPSPFSVKFKPFRLPRIQATDTVEPSITDWLNNLEKNSRDKYRSDGEPGRVTYPKSVADRLNPARVKALKASAY